MKELLTKKEMAVANKIVEILEPLSKEDQKKVIAATCILHDIKGVMLVDVVDAMLKGNQ